MRKNELTNDIYQLQQLSSEFEKILNDISNSANNNFVSDTQALQLHCAIYNIFDVGMPIVKEICDLYGNKWNKILEFKTNIKR